MPSPPSTAHCVRVLFDQQITATQCYGGVSRYFVSLTRHLNRLPDVQAQMVAAAHCNAYLRRDDALHGLSFRLDHPRRGLRYRSVLSEPVFRMASAWVRPNVVHETGYMAQAASRASGPKIVTTLHDMILERYPALFEGGVDQVETKRRALQRADAILCVSENTRRDLATWYPEYAAKARVVWHGVDLAAPTAPRYAALERPYLLYVGTRGGYKNFERLVKALGSSRRIATNFRLLCFGGGPLQAQERSLIASSGLPPDGVMQLEGDDASLAATYRHARLFVFPSEYEGFGMPLTEAMVQGCPIACSRASSFPEVAGDAAIYFDPLDVDSMRDAIEAVAMDDDGLHATLAGRARRRASLFSWQRCAEETAVTYRLTLAGSLG